MNKFDRFDRRDRITALSLFVASLLLRVFLRSQMAFYWDSAQFALAIEHYDLARSLPHPPGYILYVMLGRLVNVVIQEPHEALVWMSVVFGSGLSAMMYLLGRSMCSRTAGWAAGIIAATCPMMWFHSLIAMTYIVDGFCVTLFVLMSWRARQRGVSWRDAIMLAAMLAVNMGIRQQSGIVLIPLFYFTMFGAQQQRIMKCIVATIVCGVCVLAWLVPLVTDAGGVSRYAELARTHVAAQRHNTAWGGGVHAVLGNLGMMGYFVAAGLLLALPVLVAAYLLRVRHLSSVLSGRITDERVWFCVVWLVPGAVFWSLLYTYVPGHAFTLSCGVTVLAGIGVNVLAHELAKRAPILSKTRVATALILVLLTTNIWAFLIQPHIYRSIAVAAPLTNLDLRQHDSQMSAAFHTIRNQLPPDEVLLCHANEYMYWSFRHFQYYLPEYRNVLLSRDPSLVEPYGRQLWLGFRHKSEFFDSLSEFPRASIVLVVPPDEATSIFAPYLDTSKAVPVNGAEGTLYRLPKVQTDDHF